MNRAPTTKAKTRTGELPRVEPPLSIAEPITPQPPHDLPEMDTPGATTGITPVVVETADPDKFADDRAKGYA